MTHFTSLHSLFELDLPPGWDHNHEGNVYSFINEPDLEGVFQISAYSNKKNIEFDATEELRTEQKEYPTAQLIDVSQYKAVHYGLEDQSNSTIQYYWIIGYKNVKLFCSLFINALQDEHKIDDAYEKIVSIMASLQINSQ